MLSKQVSIRDGQEYFLLGVKDGIKYWLVEPSWDCGWYWGFGYIQTMYANRLPSNARDIDSHQHFDSMFKIGHEFEKFFDEVTFSQKEKWELAELFSQFYTLKDMASLAHTGGAHVSESIVDHGDLTDIEKKINKVMIPAITNRIMEILR